MRADMRSKFVGIDDESVELLSHDEWNEFVGATPRLIAGLVDRLVRLDVRPAPRDKDCGFCDLQPVCRYDRWAPEDSVSFRAEARRAEVEES